MEKIASITIPHIQTFHMVLTQLAPIFFDVRISAKHNGGKTTMTVMNTFCAFCIVLNGTTNVGDFDAGLEIKRLGPFLKSSKPTSQVVLEQRGHETVRAIIKQADTCQDECHLALIKLDDYVFGPQDQKALSVQVNVVGKSLARSVSIHDSQNPYVCFKFCKDNKGRLCLQLFSARNLHEIGVNAKNEAEYKSVCKSNIPPVYILPGAKEDTTSPMVGCKALSKVMKMVGKVSSPVRVAFASANYLSFTGSYDTTIPTVFEARMIFTQEATGSEDE